LGTLRPSPLATGESELQGVLGEGILGYKVMLIYRVCLEKAPWFGVLLVMVTTMDVLMCF